MPIEQHLATQHLPAIAWKTIARNVIILTDATETTQAVYRVTVKAIDINEVKKDTVQVAIGYYFADYVGHMYRIVGFTSLGSGIYQIECMDDFRTGVCPQIGRCGIVYKSVVFGSAPYLPAIKLDCLGKTARDYIDSIKTDILFTPNKKIDFENTQTPSIEEYARDYADIYGQYPKIMLVTFDADGNQWERQEASRRYLDEFGNISRIAWDDTNSLSEPCTGFIIITKTLL